MSLITSIQHAYASAAQDIVKTFKFVQNSIIPVLHKAQQDEQVIENITALVSPQAANIERVAFAILGMAVKALEDAGSAAEQNGMNIILDATVVSEIKAVAAAIKTQATIASQSVGKSTS